MKKIQIIQNINILKINICYLLLEKIYKWVHPDLLYLNPYIIKKIINKNNLNKKLTKKINMQWENGKLYQR